MTIIEILQKYIRPASLHSSEPVKQQLMDDLRGQHKLNTFIYGLVLVIVLLITLIGVAVMLFDLYQGQFLRLHVLATAGAGIPFVIELMRRVVRELSQLNLLIIIVAHSDEKSIQKLLHTLLSSEALNFRPASSDSSSTWYKS